MHIRNLLWFLAALFAAGAFKLLFDNILYAAIMARLADFGIEEHDVVAIVAANLAPIVAAMVALAAIYWLSLQHHAAKAAAANSGGASPVLGKRMVGVRGLLTRFDPLPAIVLGLALVLAGGIYWQVRYGPLTNIAGLWRPVPTLSDADKKAINAILAEIIADLNWSKQSMDSAEELSDNWQYRLQTQGPDKFMNELGLISQSIANITVPQLGILVRNSEKYPDLVVLMSVKDMPNLAGRTSALIAEVKRISARKDYDLVFVLLNDVKLLEWRAAVPDFRKWLTERYAAIEKKRAELAIARTK
jgi:hypothetical protein